MTLLEMLGLSPVTALDQALAGEFEQVLGLLADQAAAAGIRPRPEWWASWPVGDRTRWALAMERQRAREIGDLALALQGEAGRAQVMAMVDGGLSMLDWVLDDMAARTLMGGP